MHFRKIFSSISFFLMFVAAVLAVIAMLSLDAVSIDGDGVESLAASSTIVWLLVSLSLASGICAMAVVQCWKVFLRPRARFHREVLFYTFGRQYSTLMRLTAPGFGYEGSKKVSKFSIFRRFDRRLEFLDSPAEVVMAQLAEAAEYALRNPKQFRELNDILIGDVPPSESRGLETEKMELESDDQRYFLDKNLQLLHVQLHEMWRYRVRAVSVFVSAALACTICFMLNADQITIILGTSAAGLFGGVLSWLTRDVIAVVEANRR